MSHHSLEAFIFFSLLIDPQNFDLCIIQKEEIEQKS